LALPAAPAQAQEPRTISVRGDASVQVPNDLATVTVAVSRRAESAGAALRRSSKRARRVIAAVKGAGGDAVAVETLEVDVRRSFVREGDERVRVFVGTNRLRLEISDVDRTGELLAEAVGAGATSVGSVRFTRSDVRQVYRDQLVAAFEEARAKAAALAAQAGLTLGSPLAIEESGFRESVSGPSFSEDAATAPGAGGGANSEPVVPPVRPGQTSVRARVFVVFEAS
jgi:uncharacterized protein YggE